MATEERFTDQAKSAYNALKKCFENFAGSDGLPKFAPPPGGYYQDLSIPERPSLEEEIPRLVSWLNALADQDEHVAYAALLQIWLEVHGVRLPKTSVFTKGHNLASKGRGAPSKYDEIFSKLQPEHVAELRNRGLSWPAILDEMGDVAKDALPAQRQHAADSLRQMFKVGTPTRPLEPLDGSVIDFGLEMLGYPDYL